MVTTAALRRDYDHDVHPYVARPLPPLSVKYLLIGFSPAMLTLAPVLKARADGTRLPVAGASANRDRGPRTRRRPAALERRIHIRWEGRRRDRWRLPRRAC
jgi:hypothetical protein